MVGICLRARKYKLIEFEGEMLFQRRDDDVPIFLLKPIKEIRRILDEKTDEIKRGASPAPQATSVLMDKRCRSASPNVGKIEAKKELTAKVPEIKESTKELDVLSKTERKCEERVTEHPKTPVIEVHDEMQENVTIETNTPININTSVSNSIVEPAVLVPSTVTLVSEPQEQLPTESVPNIVTEGKSDENNKKVVSEAILSESKVDIVSEALGQSEIISASSSMVEIIEDVVVIEKLENENNNISKNEESGEVVVERLEDENNNISETDKSNNIKVEKLDENDTQTSKKENSDTV